MRVDAVNIDLNAEGGLRPLFAALLVSKGRLKQRPCIEAAAIDAID